MIQVLLDSSGRDLSVGLAEDGKLIEGFTREAFKQQSELLVFELDKLLRKHGLSGRAIDEVAVAIGPGSYTGVRIALTVAKTIAYADHAKLYVNNSLSLLKTSGRPTICLMDARSGRCYFGVYLDDEVLEEDRVLSDEEVLRYIGEHPDYLIAGNVGRLGIEGGPTDVLGQLLRTLSPAHLAPNVFAVKPAYLKEL